MTSLPNGDKRVISAAIAFVGAAYLPALWLALQSPGLVSSTDLVAVLGMSLVFMWFSTMFTLGLAAPLFILLLKIGRVRMWSSALTGAAVGGVVAVVLPLGMSSPYFESAVADSAPRLGLVGAVAGALFFTLLVVFSRLLRVKNPLTLEHGL